MAQIGTASKQVACGTPELVIADPDGNFLYFAQPALPLLRMLWRRRFLSSVLCPKILFEILR